MSDSWTDRWDDRYGNEEFAYGEQPNNYLRERLAQLNVEHTFSARRRGA